LLPLAADGAIDVLFVRRPLALTHPALDCLPIFRERLMVVVPAKHRLAGRRRVSIADLREDSFVVYPAGMVLHDQIQRLVQAVGFFPRISQETPHITSILELVSAGLGVSILPQSAASFAPAQVRFIACDAAETADVALVWRKAESSEAVKQFIAAARTISRTR
jgi:DNA-binding transcriptional LysR family regulator